MAGRYAWWATLLSRHYKIATCAAVSISFAGASLSCTGSEFPPVKHRVLSSDKHDLRHHLMHAALKGEGKLEQYDVSINDEDHTLVAHARLGHEVCGHPQIIHGGAIAALLDDTMGILFLMSKLGTGYTANLTVNYKRPMPFGTNVVVSARIVDVQASARSPDTKKVTIEARITAQDDASVVYTESRALFVVKLVPGGALWHDTIKATA